MPSFLSISVRFLDGAFHGRRDAGEPEWPPSPLRLYQALLAAGAAKWREDEFGRKLRPALEWLERRSPPTIVAPSIHVGAPYRLSVPNNAMDIVGRAWVRGNVSGDGDANPATHKAMKTVRPTRLVDGDLVTYLWGLPDSPGDSDLAQIETLTIVARSIVALGWGIDLVASNASVITAEERERLPGERWSPTTDASGSTLRVPRRGSLAALCDRHQAFLNRLPTGGGFNPVPPLSVFDVVGYRNANTPAMRSFAAFQFLRPDATAMRSFNTVRDLRRVVGMMRDVVRRAAQSAGWSDAKITAFVLGHGEQRGKDHSTVGSDRFAFLPIPSIEPRGVGKAHVVTNIRRIIITSFGDNHEPELSWIRRAMSGMDLLNEQTNAAEAVLSLLPESDSVIRRYIGPKLEGASTWASVTPVVLPGFDDRRNTKAETLLRRAIVQAGYSETLAAHAEIELRKVGFWAGLDLATNYRVPNYLENYPRYHVRIRWRRGTGQPLKVIGPMCLGGGRFLGLGVLAAQNEQ